MTILSSIPSIDQPARRSHQCLVLGHIVGHAPALAHAAKSAPDRLAVPIDQIAIASHAAGILGIAQPVEVNSDHAVCRIMNVPL